MGMFDDSDTSAQAYLQQALRQFQDVSTPTIQESQVNNLPLESVQGTITPEQQQAVTQGQSELNNIQLDPANAQAQQNALQGYTDIANAGGLDANAKLGIQQAINAANVQSQGAQGAIQQLAQAEGQGGGLNALALRGQAAQNASNTAANQGMQQAAMAENNRQNALSQMANIGNAAQNTQYGELANTAASQNAINAANTGTRNTVNAQNIANNMAGQGMNLQNAQNVNAANSGAQQNQTYYNASLPQQQFNNAMAKASGMAGLYGQQANLSNQANMNSANQTGQMIQGGATLLGTMYGGPAGGMAANRASGAMVNNNKGQQSGYAEGGSVKHDPVLQDIIDKYNGVNHVPGPESGLAVQTGPDGHKTPMMYETAAQGMKVPGKAEVEGDSPKNDKVHALLSPGEIVIKRSKAANPDEAAKEAKKISMEEFTKGYKARKGK